MPNQLKKTKRFVSFAMSKKTILALDLIAENKKKTRSDIIIHAVRVYLKKHWDKEQGDVTKE